eukprot:TRINITY_DN38600_c0_g1_i1.p1 TRINITY_DN38600_c0_g1~~TRINITY_DN38600_c0_g1_i1.p1  ORF type:complete len:388 (-),score=20.26 TRINITY_DN38600_c0_g1_i1:12-1109(-)
MALACTALPHSWRQASSNLGAPGERVSPAASRKHAEVPQPRSRPLLDPLVSGLLAGMLVSAQQRHGGSRLAEASKVGTNGRGLRRCQAILRLAKEKTGMLKTPKKLSLFTSADSFRFHTILGFACLVHGIARIAMNLAGVPDMGFRGDNATLGFIAMHALLNVSSFRFWVPKRKAKSGTMIWGEYREHNAVFSLRALIAMLAVWTEQRYGLADLWLVRVGALFAQLAAADWVSRHNAMASTTLAGTGMSNNMRLFLATFQLFATCNLLFGVGFWQQFCVVFAVQLTAFIMTLNRRKLVSARLVVTLYAILLLAVNQLVMLELYRTRDFTVVMFGVLAIILRLGLRWNKYYVWSIVVGCGALYKYV